MARLPLVSSRNAIAAFEKAGFLFHHQTGSHKVLRRVSEPHDHLSVPERKELARGTLRALIRQAGLTVEEFVELLGR